MLKRFFTKKTYEKIGCPDLLNKMFFMRGGKRIYGRVVLVDYFKKKDHVLIGLEPFKLKK